MDLVIDGSHFICQPYNTSENNLKLLNQTAGNFIASISTNIFIQGANYVNMSSNVFEQCGVT